MSDRQVARGGEGRWKWARRVEEPSPALAGADFDFAPPEHLHLVGAEGRSSPPSIVIISRIERGARAARLWWAVLQSRYVSPLTYSANFDLLTTLVRSSVCVLHEMRDILLLARVATTSRSS